MPRLPSFYKTLFSFLFAFLQSASSFVILLQPSPVPSFLMSTTQQEIEVVYQPDSGFLEKKGVFSWPTWGCGVSKFPWTYGESESCYLLNGRVTVTPTDGRQSVTFGKGDFVTFPSGMSCTWDVTEAVQKHYNFF
ncbi:uncharacterized protein FisN_6Hh248 [Fistulifera solaris]|uniref:(S)-ureidoglycine aminohydrolase cupin domain-containing protein n=1 Tax=Fistulifera solaris TaxID=1519565 RepID=A0A1Z5K765_FISSO|nr:uncharacterized protein FisN_6Hh248 [Fistulifera solaris]|eukprot:GAX22002.1 uncharacterized protein FisN_6Hh248 [Fistulifera solaris]